MEKWRPIIPNEHWEDEFYQKPSPEVLALVKTEKKSRKAFRGELNKIKTQEIRKDKIKLDLAKLAGLGARQKRRSRLRK